MRLIRMWVLALAVLKAAVLAAFGQVSNGVFLVQGSTTVTNYLPDYSAPVQFEAHPAVTVTTVYATNRFDTDNRKGCGVCEMLRHNPGLAIWHPYHEQEPYAEATARTNTFRVTRIVTTEFTMMGRQWKQTLEEVVLETNRVSVLKSEWRELK